jgi:REP element-mobilizing transposase RayT
LETLIPGAHPSARNRRLAPDIYATAGQSCFFTVCAAGNASPFASSTHATIAVECLLGQRLKSSCQLDIYCVMPDHIHAIVTPMRDGASSLQYIDRFKGWSARMMSLAGWSGYVWQPGCYDHVVRREESVLRIADYILHNPVRKGLCDRADEYRWSGIPEPLPVAAE